MMRVKRLVLVVVLAGMFIFAGGLQMHGQEKEKQAGYMLLNSIVVTFAELSRRGEGSEETILRELNTWMSQVRLAKEKELIDDEFFVRYKRILVVIRLTLINYANHAFDHLIIREINKFDIPRKVKGKVNGLASVANALVQEISSLKRYLDQKYASGGQEPF